MSSQSKTEAQLALDFAQSRLHGHITVYFSNGKTPVRCTIMANDKTWHGGYGDTIALAVGSAIAKSKDSVLADDWAQAMGTKGDL